MTKDLKSFFNPQSVAVVGVSESKNKLGSIILQNIIESGFTGDLKAINPKHNGEQLFDIDTLGQVSDFSESFDLVVIVVPARFTESVINDCIKNRTKNVIIISAGFGEIGENELENNILDKCHQNNINLLGPNCLGVIFPKQKLNASFSDGFPNPGKICFISQSGAFCTAVLDWAAQKNIGFSHFISLGNKTDICESDILESLANNDEVQIFALYLESVQNGKRFLQIIRELAPNKMVVILEPGRSAKSIAASASHTGALAPNSKVLEAAYKASGAIQVFSMRQMFNILSILDFSFGKNLGKNVAILTNAGGVGVLTSDLTEESNLNLIDFSNETISALKQILPAEAAVTNPVDIIGDADASRYENALKILINDPKIDQIIVLLTPQRTTEVRKTAELIIKFSQQTNKNIIASFVGGARINTGFNILEQAKIPVFIFPSDITKALGKIANRNDNLKQIETCPLPRNAELEKLVQTAIKQNLTSLPQSTVDKFLKHYHLDFPQSKNFHPSEYEESLNFAQTIFPVVLKISSPDSLHKSDKGGVILNIDSPEKFQLAWKNMSDLIEQMNDDNMTIQIQEQVKSDLEVFIGVNTDPNFGKVLVFGTGGIFTEIWGDVSMRVLPIANDKCLSKMVAETKIGKILMGARKQTFAKEKVQTTLYKIQKLVQDFPEITAIDANPLLVTEKRAICVDFKMILNNEV